MNINKVSRPFSSNEAVSELLIILLGASAAIDLVSMGIGSYEVMAPTSESTLAGVDRIIGAIQLVLHLFVWVFFLVWFYRAHRNLPSLGVINRKYSSPWSTALFLIPIANLYFGYDLVRELWKQTNPDVGFSDDFLRQHASPLKQYPTKTALIGFWWGFTFVSTRVARAAFNTPDYISSNVVFMISDAFSLAASVLLIVIVTKINERQEEKHRRLAIREAASPIHSTRTVPSAVAPG